MSDLSTNDFPLLSTLKNTDRITVTDSNTGQQFASVPVAKFLEELIRLLPVASTTGKGLMSAEDKISNPSSPYLKRHIIYANIEPLKALRLKFDGTSSLNSLSIKIYGSWSYGCAVGCTKKIFGFNARQKSFGAEEYHVTEAFHYTSSVFYITNLFFDGDYPCIDIINKNAAGNNMCVIAIETYGGSFTILENQTPLKENLTKNNRDEFLFQLKSTASAAALQSLSTDSLDIEGIAPPRKLRATHSKSATYEKLFFNSS